MPKYYMPTTLLSGKDCVRRHPRHLIHGTSCMIVTGKNSAVLSGALVDVTSVLKENGVKYQIYDGVNGDTNISETYALAQLIKNMGANYVIGIGGGSVLDVAKAAAVYATNDMAPMDIFNEKYDNAPLNVVCIPTTAGTGSDTTQYVMLTIDEPQNKHSFSSEVCFPYATYLDSRYTMTLPIEVTRNTAVDALCHAVESYLNNKASAFSDMVALEAIRLIGQCTDALVTGNITEKDREKLLTAASAGGMAVAHTGLNLVHYMGHKVTCSKHIPHGRANGALLVEFISFMAKADIMRAVKVIDAFGSDLSGFKKFIELSVPIDTEITEDDIQQWTENEVDFEVLENCPMQISKSDIHNIYYNALINKNRDYKRW